MQILDGFYNVLNAKLTDFLVNVFLVNLGMMDVQDLITIDNEILGGQAVFKGTRVPVESLFDHLEAGVSLDEFLDDFPTVSKQQAFAVSIAG